MQTINANKLGLALGTTGVALYLGCIALMLIAGQAGTIWFFNSLLHGLDVSAISRMNVSVGQSVAGIILTFGLGWITGFISAATYNMLNT